MSQLEANVNKNLKNNHPESTYKKENTHTKKKRAVISHYVESFWNNEFMVNKSLFEKKVKKIGRAHSELQSHHDLVCRLLLEKKKKQKIQYKKNKKKKI